MLVRCKPRRKSRSDVERDKRRAQAHCAMKVKIKLEEEQAQSTPLLAKWFRTVPRRVKDAKVTLEEQPESEGNHEVHYRVILIFRF